MRIGESAVKFIRKMAVFPLYVFFWSLYSILAFMAANLSQVNLSVANRLIASLCIGTLILLLFVRIFTSTFARAGAVIFPILIIFFSYEHIKIFLFGVLPAIARDIFLIPVSTLLLIGGTIWAMKWTREKIRVTTSYINIVGLILLCFPIYTISVHEYQMASYQRRIWAELAKNPIISPVSGDTLPDVYFIVLDGYARADAMEQIIGLDNSDFLDALRQRNFYVADCSMSNYAQTELSLLSTFNMIYLDELIKQIPGKGWGPDYFSPHIKNSSIRQFFESLGYRTVSFYNGYYWAQWDDATHFLGDPRITQGIDRMIPFEEEFLKTTFLRFLFDAYRAVNPSQESQGDILSSNEADRAIVLFTLDNLPVTTQLRSPKFVFVHLMLPHPPYVFGPNGEEQDILMTDTTEMRLRGYHDQVLYANNRILPIVDTILSQSNGNVVIFLEGDHGMIDYQEEWTRLANLSAYYFPDHDYSKLYPEITPINSFRVLLSQYFGQDYPLLDDFSYFSSTSADQNLKLIQNQCSGK
jgi:hypothetical protein